LTFFLDVQAFPEFCNSLVTFIFGLADCHVRCLSTIAEDPSLFSEVSEI
jgi:hypothetical protein